MNQNLYLNKIKMAINTNIKSKFIALLITNIYIIFTWLICVITITLFQGILTSFIADNSIITDKEIKGSHFNLAYTLLLIIISIRFLWLIIKNYRLSKKQNYLIFLIATIYLFVRNVENDTLWFSIYSVKCNLYYTDIILLVSILSLILLVRNIAFSNSKLYDDIIQGLKDLSNESSASKVSSLLEDIPNDETKENDNERAIEEIVSAVIDLMPQKSFIIGVNSIWGLGKTSFLQRLDYRFKKEYINKCQPITFWFNAWQHQDEKTIINNFFNELKKELATFSGESGNTIDNYLREMFALVDNKYVNFFKSFTSSIFDEEENTIKKFYDDINDIIEKIDRKIIVFVDDIDRLNRNEILEILRILRNIADFKNVIFICGFDREYVVKQSQIDNHYLDKIFNLEINLMTPNQRNFIFYLNKLIGDSPGFTKSEKSLITAAITNIFYDDSDIDYIFNFPVELNVNSELTEISLIPSFFFESKRDVKKFYNEFFIHFKILKNIDDIELKEYILLKLLLFRYKSMYKYFTTKRMQSWLGNETILEFKENDLNNLILSSDLDDYDKKIIFLILKKLFPESGVNINLNSINQKRYFPIYFANNVFNEAFSFTELTNALENNEIEKLISDRVLGKENEELIKKDINNFVFKSENINNLKEYKQVISLVKKDLIGYVEDIQVLEFILMGEEKFAADLQSLVDKIFTNSTDSFGQFLIYLNSYYSTIPNDSSLAFIGGQYVDKKIKSLKLLDEASLSKFINKIISNEIENCPEDLDKITLYCYNFIELNYHIFKFKLFSEEVKYIVKKYLRQHFETIILSKNEYSSLIKKHLIFFANIFEDLEERKIVINEANNLLNTKNSWKWSDLNVKKYKVQGLNNFMKFVEELEDSISSQYNDNYYDFLDWLHLYEKNNYEIEPKAEDLLKLKQQRE